MYVGFKTNIAGCCHKAQLIKLRSFNNRKFQSRSFRQTVFRQVCQQQNIKSNVEQDEYLQVLQKYWGYQSYQFEQREVIQAVLDGKDALIVWGTSSGKSLCYQVPPLIAKKPAIVVSPLISLMQDQVQQLKDLGIRAEFLGSAQFDPRVQQDVWNGQVDLIYLSPETAIPCIPKIVNLYKKRGLVCIAVDEAHILLEWGNDFRKHFNQLWQIRKELPDVPMVALTATARKTAETEIKNRLLMKNSQDGLVVSRTTTFRSNLFFKIDIKPNRRKKDIRECFADLIQEKIKNGRVGATIIYVLKVKDTESVYDELRQYFRIDNNTTIGMYHGKMELEDRKAVQIAFQNDELEIIVATVAFGMGVNKPNIRNIYMWGAPGSIEQCYQMAGRAGRDGLPSRVQIIFSHTDIATNQNIKQHESNQKQIWEMQEYATQFYNNKNNECRHQQIARYFGEYKKIVCGNMCDICIQNGNQSNSTSQSSADAMVEGQTNNSTGTSQGLKYAENNNQDLLILLKVVQCLNGFGKIKIISVLGGKKFCKFKSLRTPSGELVYGSGKYKPETYWEEMLVMAVQQNYLESTSREINDFKRPIYLLTGRGLKLLLNERCLDSTLENNLRELVIAWNQASQAGEQMDLSLVEVLATEKPKSVYKLFDIKGLHGRAINSFGPVLVDFFAADDSKQQDKQYLVDMVQHRKDWLQRQNVLDEYFTTPTRQTWEFYAKFQEGMSINQIQAAGGQFQGSVAIIKEISNGVRVWGPSSGFDFHRLMKESFVDRSMVIKIAEAIKFCSSTSTEIGSLIYHLTEQQEDVVDEAQIFVTVALLKCHAFDLPTDSMQPQREQDGKIKIRSDNNRDASYIQANDIQVLQKAVKVQRKRRVPWQISQNA